jgi:putative DNA methylase
MIERHFQIPFVARLALAEKQIQQNYRPLIAVHKWFARRPGTLFRALILSELGGQRIEQTYFHGHRFSDKHILDPFMGGGTTVVEANRLGCMVTAADINPMAWWIVRQEIQDLDLKAYAEAAAALRTELRKEIGHLFLTKCPKTGRLAEVKYYLWVKKVKCSSCGKEHDLFPNHLIAQDVRHTANVFVCGHCGSLFESKDRKHPGPCPCCGKYVPTAYAAGRNRSRCLHCDAQVAYPVGSPPEHRLFAIEYHVPNSPGNERRKGRLFKASDAEDLAKFAEAEDRLRRMRPRFIPEDTIPEGDETERLHRWGYRRYRELFNDRQLVGLELSCRWIDRYPDERIREALATNLSDLLRYQNMLCRYDIMALKSLDIFSVHGFPVGLIQCESNILGIEGTRGLPVGSGGWLNITKKFAKAKRYCRHPFEVRHEGNRKVEVPIAGEWIGTSLSSSHQTERRQVDLICGDSTALRGTAVFDGVFTDPPYFGNVQYAELMDFCYVWLRKLAGAAHQEFASATTRNTGELTGNINMGRDLVHFTEGISATFRMAAVRLRSGCPLAFTFHHNKLDAYVPLAVAILDAGLTCSASLPCPAEMGASIHINGTGSSVVDTVFVCRQTGLVPRRWVVGSPKELADLIQQEIEALAEGGLEATQGDIRCISCGHLTRLAVWYLRAGWKREAPTLERMAAIQAWYSGFGGLEAVQAALESNFSSAPQRQEWIPAGMVRETPETYDEIPF